MEAVLAKAGEMAASPDQIFSAFSNADLRFSPVTDAKGNQVPLSHGTFIGFLQSKDRRVRKEAFEKYYAEYEKHKNMLAATFGANLKQAAFFADLLWQRRWMAEIYRSRFMTSCLRQFMQKCRPCIVTWHCARSFLG